MIGKTISLYRIVEKLGGGGMGVVYKAVSEIRQHKRGAALALAVRAHRDRGKGLRIVPMGDSSQ